MSNSGSCTGRPAASPLPLELQQVLEEERQELLAISQRIETAFTDQTDFELNGFTQVQLDQLALFDPTRLSDQQRRTERLKLWSIYNFEYPYPDREARDQLARDTGMSPLQIKNWFANMRKRNWKGIQNRTVQPSNYYELIFAQLLNCLDEKET